jgi:hypothetical protein
MIKTLPSNILRRYNSIQQWAASRTVSGTWIAVSPVETLPEEYESRVGERNDFRVLYNIPENWRLVELSKEDNKQELVNRAIMDIYSIPGHKTIKELNDWDTFLWAVTSRDLDFHMCYNYEILEEKPWIEKGGWKLICIGSASRYMKKTREAFISGLSNDITYEMI